MKLDGRIALVRGGSQGIGETTALRLAAEGASVAVGASSSLDKAAAVVAKLPGGAGRHMAAVCDVRNAAATNKLVDEATKRFGQIDILVNAAGVFYATPAGATFEEDFDRMVDINLKGTWNLILKNHGYELEHNFGHGQKFLAMTFAALNLLAFAWHTVLELLEPPWQTAREAAAKRTSFFAHILMLTAYVVFPSWEVLLESLTTFTIPPELVKSRDGP